MDKTEWAFLQNASAPGKMKDCRGEVQDYVVGKSGSGAFAIISRNSNGNRQGTKRKRERALGIAWSPTICFLPGILR